MRQSPRAHYVGHNATTRVPRAYVYLDTEAHRIVSDRHETQTFRLAVAAFDAKSQHKDGWREREWLHTDDQRALWEWVTSKCRRRQRTVLVAHNLAYDLRIADAFTVLPAFGWKFKSGRVDDGQAWFVWTSEGRTLAMVDSLSWVPTALGKLGDLIGLPKLELPDWEDTNETWDARCTRDVEILADVWRRLMGWIVADDLGNWKLSGAGQSWAAYRHRFMPHPLLVHEDDDARRAERAAAHTGRCEAWQHGELTGGPYTEWDFECAYARIGKECLVPTRLYGEVRNPTLASVTDVRPGRAVLAEVEVNCDRPVLAVRDDGHIVWPLGHFRTTCWDNELALAIGGGADIAVRRAWIYRTTPALRDFCAYVLAGLHSPSGALDPVVLVALKHWSRALIGRTAAQWSRWEPWGTSPVADVSVSPAYFAGEDDTTQLMQLGHQLIRRHGTPDNPDAMVSVMSWVMAECRVRLWGAMSVAGFENLVYVDTDSLIVTEAGSRRLREAAIEGLRVKGVWSTLKVLGPRQIIPGGRLRAAGVPRDAVEVSEGVWEAEVWSGLATSLRSGQSSSVQVARRQFRLHGTDRRRTHLPGGLTAPVRSEVFVP